MKFNLKNRPKARSEDLSKELLATIALGMEDWFEGFEKELRDWQENLKDLPENHVARVILKEILGDE